MEKVSLFICMLISKNLGLGLSIVGGSDTVLGTVVIHEVYTDGAAAIDGRLRPGDQIFEVIFGMQSNNLIHKVFLCRKKFIFSNEKALFTKNLLIK